MSSVLAIYLGLIAGLSPSPANANLLRFYSHQNHLPAYVFAFGGLLFDILLVLIGLSFKNLVLTNDLFLGILSLFAAFYFGKIFFQRRSGKFEKDRKVSLVKYFIRGIGVQSINPNPWIFWSSVGIIQALENSFFPLVFLFTTYFVKITLLKNLISISSITYPIFKFSFALMSIYYLYLGFSYFS